MQVSVWHLIRWLFWFLPHKMCRLAESWDRNLGSDVEGCCRSVVCTWATRFSPVHFCHLWPPINCSWPVSPPPTLPDCCSLCLCPHVPLSWIKLFPLSIKWGHSHTQMCCNELAQWRQMVMEQETGCHAICCSEVKWSLCCSCNPDFGYPHTH